MHVFFIYEICDDILVNLCFRVSNNIKTAFNLPKNKPANWFILIIIIFFIA